MYARNGMLDRTSELTAHLRRILPTTDVDLGGFAFPGPTVDYSMRNLTEQATDAIQSFERSPQVCGLDRQHAVAAILLR